MTMLDGWLVSQTGTGPNWDQLLFAALAIVFMFGSAIMGWIKKKLDEAALARKQRERELRIDAASPAAPDTSRGPNLDERLAQRRADLQEAVRRRQAARQGTLPPPRPGGDEPQNLTMAERIARARAKEQYRERAQTLQGEAESARRRATEEAAAQREAVRRRELAAEAERRRREAEAARQRQQQQQRQRQPQQRRPQAAPQRAQPMPMPAAEARRRAEAETRRVAPPAAPAARTAPIEAGTAPASSARPARSLPGLRGVSLRDAFVAKEILDRPVSMREPFDELKF